MKVSYRPTFDQFADNYLATHYSGGVRVFQRTAGGPALIIGGALAMVWVSENIDFWLLRYPLLLLGLLVALYGLSYTLRPLFNLLLVWLRRKELFEGKAAITTLELKGGILHVTQGKDQVKLPLDQILTVQHRSTSTWILTASDNLVYLPREGLLTGKHDPFIKALEEKMVPEDEGEEGG